MFVLKLHAPQIRITAARLRSFIPVTYESTDSEICSVVPLADSHGKAGRF